MPAPRGANPEHNMCQALILFMKENIDKVQQIAEPFLSKKKLTLDAYITFMEQPGHRGDELALLTCCDEPFSLLHYNENQSVL